MSKHPTSWHTLIGYRRNGAPIYLHRGGSEPAGEGQGQQSGGQQAGQPGAGQGGQQGGQGEFTAPKDQAELDRLIGERLARERAKYADYDEAKRKAAEFDKAAEAQKTELQKATDRAAEAERQANEREARALRAEVALEKGLTPSQAKRLVGGTRDELVADADELIKDLGKTPGAGGAATSFDQGKQGGAIKTKPGEAGHAEAQKRFGKPATAGNTT